MKTGNKTFLRFAFLLLMLVGINVIASQYFNRFDLTKNKRYSLSAPTKDIVQQVDKNLLVRVYLEGDFTSNFRRLENETRYLLEEFSAQNRNIQFQFINPLEYFDRPAQAVGEQFFQAGMPPKRLNIKKNGKEVQSLIFPWAVATYGEKSVKIPLLQMSPGDSNEELVTSSVQNLEYAFANAFKRLSVEKNKKIAILKGNGELPDLQIGSFLKTVGAYYHTAPFTLDSVAESPQKTLKNLREYDLMVVAKPTVAFTEKEKYVLDQYLMNGGKALWLVDAVNADIDSIFANQNHSMIAYPNDLKLTSFFFKYGVRIMPSLINDLHADNIILASGHGKQTQFSQYPWYYSPLVVARGVHPVVNNIDPIRFDFASPIDTLKNGIEKTVLLKSSVATRVDGTPRLIKLNMIAKKPKFETYQDGPQIMAVLLEGKFTSVFKNRIKPFSIKNPIAESVPTKMIVIADGDVIKNDLKNGRPTSLAYDPKTGQSYGNKEFLLNAVNYMLDDSGLLNIRSQKINIAFLDSEKIAAHKLFWQLMNIGLPLLILCLFGFGFSFYRRKAYRQ